MIEKTLIILGSILTIGTCFACSTKLFLKEFDKAVQDVIEIEDDIERQPVESYILEYDKIMQQSPKDYPCLVE